MLHCHSPVLVGLLLAVVLPTGACAQDEAASAVRQKAEEVLASRFPDSADHFGVRVRRVRGSVDSTAQLRLAFPEREEAPGGLTRVEVRTRAASGQWDDAGWALLHVARFDTVLTARRRLRAGEPVTRSKVERAWMEVTDFHGDPLPAAELRTRLREGELVAARFVQSGRALRERDVRRPYAAEAGTAIEVHHRRGRVSFRLSCTAREPGHVGDVIRVHCSDFGTTYRVRVTGKDAARWLETL